LNKYEDLKIYPRKQLLKKPPFTIEALPFGVVNTDHMLSINWDNETGWHRPKIMAFEDLTVDLRW
jgi:hypothetical protein